MISSAVRTFVVATLVLSIVLLLGLSLGSDGGLTPQATPKAVETPRPFPKITIESWSNRITEVEGKTVYINLGDRAGGMGSDDDSRLALKLLSYSLNSHPNASVFMLFYSYTVANGTDEFEVIYNRKQKTFATKSGGRGKPIENSKPPLTGINDKAIHAAAIGYGSYHDIKKLAP